MGRMTKAQIKKTLEENSIDNLLLPKSEKFTTKQRNFAKGIANGLTKSDAYRNAYDTTMNPSAVHADAQKLLRNPRINLLIDAYTQANQARDYHSPARLRELVVNTLVMHAIDEDIKPAQRLKATELLGKLTEVGSFTERKETTVIHQSAQLKAKLLDQLKTIVNEDGSQMTEDDGDRLLRELMGSGVDNRSSTPPTHSHTPATEIHHPSEPEHITPHTRTTPESADAIHTKNEIVNENNDLLTVKNYSDKKEGVGGDKKAADAGWKDTGSTPLSDLDTMDGEGV